VGSVCDFLIRIDNRTVGVDHSIAILRAGIFYVKVNLILS